jgi:hypothetical protein
MKKLIFLAFSLVLAACSQSRYQDLNASPKDAVAQGAAGGALPSPGNQAGQAARRYLALKHRVTLLVPEATLAQRFAAIEAECRKLACDILGTSEEAAEGHRSASAKLRARVPPAAFAGFFRTVQAQGKLQSHQSESEDKTAEVIDVEARIKNLEALRARVLELLAKRTASLKDTLEAEQQLSNTQAALDSINGQRRVLANQTEMVAIEIELTADSVRNGSRWNAPLVRAADDAGEVLVSSLAFLLTASVALLPWLVVLGAVLVWVRWMWRRRRGRKQTLGR